MGVEPVAEHVMVLMMPLCAVAVEVLADVCKLLYRLTAFKEPASGNLWQNAECCLIQDKQRIALRYALGNQPFKLFLKRFCEAISAL